MARRRKRVDGLVAVTPGGDITMDHIIGWVASSRVPDRPVSGAKLLRTWAGHDLDTTLIPQDRQPVHIFQSACRSVETRRVNGHVTEVKVDEVKQDAIECVYQVTRMVRDRENLVIDHPKAMTVAFDKKSSAISFIPRDHAAYQALKGTEDQIVEHFEKNAKTIPGAKVRNAIRDYLFILGGSNLRKKSGGLYFVPKSKESKKVLDTLGVVLEKLYGDDAELWTLPMADTDTERKLVERHFVLNVNEKAEETISKAAAVLARDAKDSYVRKDVLRNVLSERKQLGEWRDQYAALLHSEVEEANAKFSILDDQIEALVLRAPEVAAEITPA